MEASNISVVITHYNDLEGLSECIAAWGKQTVKPLEVIVVDDGSRSQLGLEVWKASFRYAFRLVCHPKNLGVPAAMNTGLREVTGAYVHFASCSDMPDRDFIKTFLPYIWPTPWGTGPLPLAIFARARWVDDRTGVEWTSKAGDLVSHAAVFRVDELKPFDEDLKWHCDWLAMKQSSAVPAFAHEIVKVIHLKRGQYSDVDRYGDENLDVLHNLIGRILDSPNRVIADAVESSWLADFGLPAIIAALYHPLGRGFLDLNLVRRAAWRELEILGRRYLPAWAQRLAIRLFIA